MNEIMSYCLIFALLLLMELLYFKLAERYKIVDKPNERSSHNTIVLRGGGIIFLFGIWVWGIMFNAPYPWMLAAVTLAGGISFIDDIHSLPPIVRLVTHFIAMGLLFVQLNLIQIDLWRIAILALIVFVGATNIINFMDGINGITAGYSLSVLVPLLLLNKELEFIETSYLIVVILSVLIFSFFNFRPKGKAKCFAGDIGSISIAFLLLFGIGKLIQETHDITWLVFFGVYGIDGCLTIIHRLMLHEKLGEPHRKHAYQLMANELGMNHVSISLIYSFTQMIISLVYIYLIPNTLQWHWIYTILIISLLTIVYVLFMKKYFHLHEDYLTHLNK